MAAKTNRGRSPATPALKVLASKGVAHDLHEVDLDDLSRQPMLAPNFGVQVAERLGSKEGAMFKTLVTRSGDNLYCAVIPVEKQLNLKKLAAAVGEKKVALASPRDVERVTGYVLGGVSPLGMRTALPTVFDQTIEDHETVFVSAGARGLVAEVAPKDLLDITSGRVAPITRW